MLSTCPFCCLFSDRVLHGDANTMVVRDGFPVSVGHTLLITRRHVGSFFDLTDVERQSLMAMLNWARNEIQREYQPDGFNIGFNDGIAAGQTIPHLHIHLIPRYSGDLADPRGGVRWIIPAKAKYWE
jgi:diadenosine tetraphosphate (Ap4A) HIT family hydrolase